MKIEFPLLYYLAPRRADEISSLPTYVGTRLLGTRVRIDLGRKKIEWIEVKNFLFVREGLTKSFHV